MKLERSESREEEKNRKTKITCWVSPSAYRHRAAEETNTTMPVPRRKKHKKDNPEKILINLARNMTEIELVTESTSVDLMVQIKCEEKKKRKGKKNQGPLPHQLEENPSLHGRTTFGPGSPTGTPPENAQTTATDCLTSKLFCHLPSFSNLHPNTNTQHTNPASNQPAFRLLLKS
jgi:hypothetical protein